MRPSTEGCTEWTCPFHGGDNRFKAGHAEWCPIRSYDGFVLEALDPDYDGLKCTCGVPS